VTFPKDYTHIVTVNGVRYIFHEWQYSANEADWYRVTTICTGPDGVHDKSSPLTFLWTSSGAVPR